MLDGIFNGRKDIARGYEKIKAAYEEISTTMDEQLKNILGNLINQKKFMNNSKDSSLDFKLSGIKLVY
jgi:mRNA-degrading endonuclease YafQ of YafQ-DinJ toxin-antitoxin module